MKVPLTVGDFLDRAALVFRDRTAVVDEPDAPAGLGALTYGQLEARARGMALALEQMGIDERGTRSDRKPQRGSLPHLLLWCQRLRARPRPDQLPPVGRGDPVHRRPLRRIGVTRRP